MKAITLMQPWASLVVLGLKKIETRSWQTKYRGELLIHASVKEFKPQKGMESLMGHLEWSGFFDKVPHMPYGAIIGSVNLSEVSTSEFFIHCSKGIPLQKDGKFIKSEWEQELAFGDFSPGRYGWLLSDPVQFDKPIPAKGSLSIWEFHYEK